MTARNHLKPVRPVGLPEKTEDEPQAARPSTFREPQVQAEMGTSVRVSPNRLIPGTRYEVKRWLGDGAMGVVYEAEHVDIKRRVAVKILRPQLGKDPSAVRAFRREAQAVNRVGSRNVVQVHDFAELADGRVLFAMDLVEGETLGDVLADGPLEAGRALGILRQLCKALGAAHSAGVIHRDVKPHNVLLTRVDSRADFVKVLDFGIAAMRTGEDDGIAAGTAAYMAPEQIALADFDGRLDIYALGCTAYEMFTGHLPFESTQIGDLLVQHIEEEPAPPSHRTAAELPPGLDALLLRCLAKDPADRFADMADLEAALCEMQIDAGLITPWDDLPPPDVDPDRRDRILRGMPDLETPRSWGRSRLAWLLGGVLTVGAMSGAAVVSLTTPEMTAQIRSEVDELMVDARAAAARASFVYPPADDAKDETAYRIVLRLEGMDGVEQATEAAEELRAEFSNTLARLGDYYWEQVGGQPFAMDYYAQVLMFDPLHEVARARSGASFGDLASLRLKAARQGFSREELVAVEALVPLSDLDPQKRVSGLEDLVAKRQGRSASSEAQLTRMLEGERHRLAVERGEAPAEAAAGELAELDPEEAVVEEPDAGAEEPEELPSEPPEAAAAEVPEGPAQSAKASPGKPVAPKVDSAGAAELARQGKRAAASGRSDQAEILFARALSADPRNRVALIGLADLYFDRTAYAKAAKYARKAVAVSPSNAGYRMKLGDAYFKSLRYEDALAEYRRAKSLGHKAAASRIEKVNKKLGR